jgi:DNA-binding response OmpR family regulator
VKEATLQKGDLVAERLKVPIIDDKQAYCVAMSDVLEFAGADVRVANTANEAETLFRLVEPDLVIMDLLMPGAGGWNPIRGLRAAEGLGHVPVIVASGMTSLKDRIAALEAGADSFIIKPFMPKELRDAVRRLIALPKTGVLPPAG